MVGIAMLMTNGNVVRAANVTIVNIEANSEINALVKNACTEPHSTNLRP